MKLSEVVGIIFGIYGLYTMSTIYNCCPEILNGTVNVKPLVAFWGLLCWSIFAFIMGNENWQ